ncbi:hypothetical protein CGRA01v4_06854 [Colletotrichum graminicola]|uniref:Uncharacterized protein n=1 Tax=Colletotrichum graminicola (strain M1.001 / M2 / FGSC 10212) TaxID=645133 RepID=E3Q2R6_COLGM|nr:uncharacterized protein GLRG_00039 [Colletotrichum graminicola M1.001]EFQ24895.1 hypothetical protein GLRG_00039 [Colletotrichum graminicola M1.001]WDK15573.1 hypothetical protein CGRA01v4_06854 [Colletotrichum graminicola]
MKSTLFALVAVLAATVAATPVKGIKPESIKMSRSEAEKAGIVRRDRDVSDSVNYILVLIDEKDGVDAYQEEVDAARANPSDTLG